jgi:hypothetical protein
MMHPEQAHQVTATSASRCEWKKYIHAVKGHRPQYKILTDVFENEAKFDIGGLYRIDLNLNYQVQSMT